MIDGTWVPASAQMGGQSFPDAILKNMQLSVAAGRYVVAVGPQLDKGTVAIDASTTPMSMTVTGEEGPNVGKTYPAIFELAGDTPDGERLRICYDLSGQQRPSAFTSAPGTMHFNVEYRRTAP